MDYLNGNQLAFGEREKNFTDQEKRDIAYELKNGRFNKHEYIMSVYRAEQQAGWFYKFGTITTPAMYAVFYNFPIIRVQPTLRRSLAAAAPAYMWYMWHQRKGEEIWWAKVYNTYQKWCVFYDRHPRVTL